MTVIDHAPHHWFLLEQEGQFYLDVNCSHGAVGYSVLIMLDDAEVRGRRNEGRVAIDRLADQSTTVRPVRGTAARFIPRATFRPRMAGR